MALLASHLVSASSANQVRQFLHRCPYLVSENNLLLYPLLLYDVSSPGVAPLTWVLGRPASPVPLGTRTRAELTPDSGLSHWWALPQVLPRTPRLGSDRLGFY